MKMNWNFFGTITMVALLGCGGEQSGPPFRAAPLRTDTIGDTVTVRNSVAVWTDTARLIVDAVIGRAEGPEEFMFALIQALAADQYGNVYVADQRLKTIRKYSSRGDYLMTFGRSGRGPGEYLTVTGLAVTQDGRLLARDMSNRRINVYDSDGTPLDHWPVRAGDIWSQTAVMAGASGETYANFRMVRSAEGAQLQGVFRLGTDGSMADTLFAPGRYRRSCPIQWARGLKQQPLPRIPDVAWTFSTFHNALIIGCSADYSFDILHENGSTTRITRAWEPISMSRAERSFRIDHFVALVRTERPGWRWSGSEMGDTKPAYRRLFAGAGGRVWVQTYQHAQPHQAQNPWPGFPTTVWRESTGFDVFDRDGRYLGPVQVPENFQADSPEPVFRGDTVWAITRDRDNLPFVTRYHLSVGS